MCKLTELCFEWLRQGYITLRARSSLKITVGIPHNYTLIFAKRPRTLTEIVFRPSTKSLCYNVFCETFAMS